MDIKTEIKEDSDFDVAESGFVPDKGTIYCKMMIKKEVSAESWFERTPVKVKSEFEEVSNTEPDYLPPELIICKEEPLFLETEFRKATSSVSELCKQENTAFNESQDTDNGKDKQLSPVESNRACEEETSSAYLVKEKYVTVRTDLQGSNSAENTINAVHACTLCDRSFTKLSLLISHYAVHERKTNDCTVCKKSFTVQRDLEKHYLSHEKKGLHKCNFCERRFTRQYSLRLHHLQHQGSEQQYKCDICGKEFRLVNSLRRHIAIHNLKLLYRCELCDTKYNRMDQFERHNMIHEGKGQYKCEISDK